MIVDQARKPDGAQVAMGEILHFIRARGYEPGERLPSERELAERFDVSRNTVREVLGTLECFRLVERRPGSGVYLCAEVTAPSLEALVLETGVGIELDEQEVLESMETRYLLELQAVRLCCERRKDEDIARLRKIVDDTASRVREGGNVAEFDSAFHLAIVAGTQNSVLVRVVRPFYLLSGAQRVHYFTSAARARKSLSDHRKLLAAVEAKDPDLASELLVGHLGTVEDYWRGALRPERPGQR